MSAGSGSPAAAGALEALGLAEENALVELDEPAVGPDDVAGATGAAVVAAPVEPLA
jgi:hypothetical protein